MQRKQVVQDIVALFFFVQAEKAKNQKNGEEIQKSGEEILKSGGKWCKMVYIKS